MSQTDPALAGLEDQFKQSMNVLGKLVERITPWLVEVGNWLFGGLIAFNLLVIAALLAVGPGDPAILVSAVAFALALPLEVAGLVLLRLDQDLKHVKFEEEVAQAFQEFDFPGRESVAPPTGFEARRKRRTRIVLSYCLGILVLSVVLTVTGMIAALWHIAWWVGVAFLAMVLISQSLVITALITSQPPDPAKKQKRWHGTVSKQP